MKRHRVILDSNVIVASLRSRTGASYRLLATLGHARWQSVVTPALMFEYEDVVRRPGNAPGLSEQDITDVLDAIYQHSHRQFVYFSWRPMSADTGDDFVLEAAVAGGCDFIVSFNKRHLRPVWEFGIRVLSPADLLRIIGEIT